MNYKTKYCKSCGMYTQHMTERSGKYVFSYCQICGKVTKTKTPKEVANEPTK